MRAARLRPGGVRRQRPARAAGAGAAPGRRPPDRRAHPRPRGVVGRGARRPPAAAPDRRLGRRADLRQRVVPRRASRRRCRRRRPRRMVRLSPGVDPDRFHPGCGGAEVRRRLGIVARRAGRRVHRPGWSGARGRTPWSGPGRRCCARHPGRPAAARRRRAGPAAARAAGGAGWGCAARWCSPAGCRGSEVPAYTDAGDVFAMPCRTRLLGLEPEAWGIVFLEAQACGLPVVVGDSGGAPETLLGRGEVGARRRRRWPPRSSGCSCRAAGSGCGPAGCPTGRAPSPASWPACWPSDMPKAATLGGERRPSD